jgi:DNA-directed RNA polymerase specialized sigma24 family protein
VRNRAGASSSESLTVITVEDIEAVELAHAMPGDLEAETPEAALIAKTDAERLRAAIAALPTPFRETLVLRDVEGFDYREIAEATEVPIGHRDVATFSCARPVDRDDREQRA